ncbi:hypothetical protein Tco_0065863 [Tanacetum coccineum]
MNPLCFLTILEEYMMTPTAELMELRSLEKHLISSLSPPGSKHSTLSIRASYKILFQSFVLHSKSNKSSFSSKGGLSDEYSRMGSNAFHRVDDHGNVNLNVVPLPLERVSLHRILRIRKTGD